MSRRKAAAVVNYDDVGHATRDTALAQLRAAALYARVIQLDIETVALALQAGIITPEKAVELLDQIEGVSS